VTGVVNEQMATDSSEREERAGQRQRQRAEVQQDLKKRERRILEEKKRLWNAVANGRYSGMECGMWCWPCGKAIRRGFKQAMDEWQSSSWKGRQGDQPDSTRGRKYMSTYLGWGGMIVC